MSDKLTRREFLQRGFISALGAELAPGAVIVRPVAAGEIVTWDDVKLDEGSVVVKLRRQQDKDGTRNT